MVRPFPKLAAFAHAAAELVSLALFLGTILLIVRLVS